MSQMSRAQRMLLVYILFKLSQPRITQEINKFYGAGGGISSIQEASDVDTVAIGDDKILVYKTSSSKHEYEAKPSGYTDADAVAAVEAEAGLTFTGGLTLGDDLDFGGKNIVNFGYFDSGNFRPAGAGQYLGTSTSRWKGIQCERVYSQYWYGTYSPLKIVVLPGATGRLDFWGGATPQSIVASVVGASFEIPLAGDITMLATKSVDAYTNAGYIKLRRLSQSAEPTPDTGELLFWRDTDDDKTYLVYEDPDVGGRKIELT